VTAGGVGFQVLEHHLLFLKLSKWVFFVKGFSLLVVLDFGKLSKVFFLFFAFVVLSFFIEGGVIISVDCLFANEDAF
jgi:hypothetical protein